MTIDTDQRVKKGAGAATPAGRGATALRRHRMQLFAGPRSRRDWRGGRRRVEGAPKS